MTNVDLKTIHKDLHELRQEIRELKIILISEPELREDVIRRINEARQRIKKEFIIHEQMMKEFVGQ